MVGGGRGCVAVGLPCMATAVAVGVCDVVGALSCTSAASAAFVAALVVFCTLPEALGERGLQPISWRVLGLCLESGNRCLLVCFFVIQLFVCVSVLVCATGVCVIQVFV